jgi:hypothetical protein
MLDLGFNAGWKAALKEFLFEPEDFSAHGYRIGLNAFVFADVSQIPFI